MKNTTVMNTICRLFEEVDSVKGGKGYVVALCETETICYAELNLTDLVNIKCTEFNTIEIITKQYDETVRRIYDCSTITNLEIEEIICAEDACGKITRISREEVAFK